MLLQDDNIIIVIFVVMIDDDYHQCIFSEWSSLDLAWTSAFSLIVVTSVVGNVMVAFFQSAIFNSIHDTLDHNMLREFMVFFIKINSHSLEDMQVGYISQKYSFDKYTLG